MFERFTEAARAAVVAAQEHARASHCPAILAEHLLLGVLEDEESAGAGVLREQGVSPGRLSNEITGLGAGDADALQQLGIDLDAVRERVEAAFGPGALDRREPRRTGLLRRRGVLLDGHLPVSDPAKSALARSLREAVSLHSRRIGSDHLLLGLLADTDSPAAGALQRLGVDPAACYREVRARIARAA